MFTCCQPAQLALQKDISTSASFTSISISSTSGMIATVIALVCTLHFDSVSGILCTLCTHDSYLNLE
ncbi:MAG: hypothetical protein Q8S84_06105 [bacterium]|nr:hypothetical protein [bacterium]MDP3381052.1 hypothetical protein [bacterium]